MFKCGIWLLVLVASKSGRVIAYNIQLTSFMHTRKEWDAWLIEQNKLRKKRALGEEIIGDEVKHAATSEGKWFMLLIAVFILFNLLNLVLLELSGSEILSSQ